MGQIPHESFLLRFDPPEQGIRDDVYNPLYGRRGEQAVPLRIARQLKAERDELLAELRRAREQLGQLEVMLQESEQARQGLRERMARLDRKEKELREQLARSLRAARAAAPDETSHQACEQKIDALRRDLEEMQGALEEALQERDTAREQVGRIEQQLERLEQAPVVDPPRAEERPDPDELRGKLREVLSDLERVKRRRDQEIVEAVQQERTRLLGRLGEVRDSVVRALANSEDSDSPWHQGLEGIRQQVDGLLSGEGVQVTGHVGEAFDPTQHEAVGVVADPKQPNGTVLWVDRHGLSLDDGTVLRPAQVVVSR